MEVLRIVEINPEGRYIIILSGSITEDEAIYTGDRLMELLEKNHQNIILYALEGTKVELVDLSKVKEVRIYNGETQTKTETQTTNQAA